MWGKNKVLGGEKNEFKRKRRYHQSEN